MTYIIGEPCIDIKDLSCVDVCPVDCIHQADRMLVIDPEECIDCGACEPECPVEAIFPEDALPEKWEPFVKINYAYGDGMDVINELVDEYATEHNVQNPPLKPAKMLAHFRRGKARLASLADRKDPWERGYAGVRRRSRGMWRSSTRAPTPATRQTAAAPGQRASGAWSRTKPPTDGPTMKPMSQEMADRAM